jgi:radical SAM superfamily enzyme YgiQ (UPF0313 family)
VTSRKNPRIAFIAVDLRWEDDTGYFAPFSYAAYKLEAAIRGCEELEHVETRVFELEGRDPEVFLAALLEYQPTMVAASTYLWSLPTFVTLAKRLKQLDAGMVFIMGGPSARRSMLELEPYREDARHIDAVVFGDGEAVIRSLARHHLDDDWRTKVPGLNYRGSLGWRSSGELERPVLDDYITPYHLGSAPPGKMGFFESYRGCPIGCAFCQWGDERADRVHGREYLTQMLRSLDASGVKDVMCLDAALNLSPRAFRALLEAEREVGAFRNRRLQSHLYPLMLKPEHYEFIEMIGDFMGAIGIQSLDPGVLEVLGRPYDPERFTAAIDSMRGVVTIDTEFIMGLPRDNPKAFRKTFHKVVDMSDNVRVFWCLALPDALLERTKEFDIRFDPHTLMVESCMGWTADDLRREWDYMMEFGAKYQRMRFGPNWIGFGTTEGDHAQSEDQQHERRDETQRAEPELTGWTMPRETFARLHDQLERQALGWQVRAARRDRGALLLELDSPGGGVVLEIVAEQAGTPSFHAHRGVAYSYRGRVDRDDAKQLRQVIELVHDDASPLVPAR